VVVCGVVEAVREVVEVHPEVEEVEALVGVGVVLLAWDEDGDGDGPDGDLGRTEDAASEDDISEGGEPLWRRVRGLHHLAGHRRHLWQRW
jgi:hypothetical protein